MKTEKRAQQIREKIEKVKVDKTVISSYRTHDNSVQAELRLHAGWTISVPVDEIHYPKSLAPTSIKSEDGRYADTPAGLIWGQMHDLDWEITKTSKLIERHIPEGYKPYVIPINAKTKTGPERRTEAKNLWLIETGKQFLLDYRTVTEKRRLTEIRKQITALQAQQKNLLPKLRESNSAYLAGKKTEREAQAAKNAEALKSGRFWEADKDTLKGYFHPPFDKNYLADVCEKWRAALFLECESISYKWGDGNWGHKLGGTGRGYLCGIDDNGDEWGHRVENLPQSSDAYGNNGLDSTVEEAMSNLFGIKQIKLANCQRQGDLLFCPEKIRTEDSPEHCSNCGQPRDKHVTKRFPAEDGNEAYTELRCYDWGYNQYEPHIHKAIVLTPEEKWTPRESHEITSPSLQRNGQYFRADHEITITHTSHPPVILPPGEYRLYPLMVADAD